MKVSSTPAIELTADIPETMYHAQGEGLAAVCVQHEPDHNVLTTVTNDAIHDTIH